jgi:radical SAM superfamily enzyme
MWQESWGKVELLLVMRIDEPKFLVCYREAALMYERGEFRALEMDEYVNIVCDQLELLPAEIVIQRVTGDGAKDDLVAPLWSLKKFCVMNEIDKEMGRRNSWQGKALSE